MCDDLPAAKGAGEHELVEEKEEAEPSDDDDDDDDDLATNMNDRKEQASKSRVQV